MAGKDTQVGAETTEALDADATAAALFELITGEETRDSVKSVMTSKPNFWDVVDYGDRSHEIRYSKMLGWLLDPSKDHGLGTLITDGLANLIGSEERAFSHSDTEVRVEWRDIDILVIDHKKRRLIAIENKTTSSEHDRSNLGVLQTEWYAHVLRDDFDKLREIIEAASARRDHPIKAKEKKAQLEKVMRWESDPESFEGFEKEYVFLAPHPEAQRAEDPTFGDDGPSSEQPVWLNLSYSELEPLLERAILQTIWRGDRHSQKIIEDFYFAQKRRFDEALEAPIENLYADASLTGPWTSRMRLSRELARLADQRGLLGPEIVEAEADAQSEAEENQSVGKIKKAAPSYSEIAVRASQAPNAVGFYDTVKELLKTKLSAPGVEESLRGLSNTTELDKLIELIWERRPRIKAQDQTKDRTAKLLTNAVFDTLVPEHDCSLAGCSTDPRDPKRPVHRVQHPAFDQFGDVRVRKAFQAIELFYANDHLSQWFQVMTKNGGKIPGVSSGLKFVNEEGLAEKDCKEVPLFRQGGLWPQNDHAADAADPAFWETEVRHSLDPEEPAQLAQWSEQIVQRIAARLANNQEALQRLERAKQLASDGSRDA